ncbi:MAG: molybdopterin-dependent oxidoreductase [Sulfuricurvum sp.]
MYLESRRTFLKGAAFTVAGASIAKGVFSTDAVAESVKDTKFTNTPDQLHFYPDHSEWDSFAELDGTDWKRGGINRKGVRSSSNPDGIYVNDYIIVPTACSNCEASCGLTAWIDKKTFTVKKYMGNPLHIGSRGRNCAKGYAAQSQMYDPDRIPFPLKRAEGSKRGEGKWVRTTWDEALTTIGKKYHDTLKVGDEMSRKLCMYHVGRPNENGFVANVMQTMGIDSYNSHSNICSAGARSGLTHVTNSDRPSPDYANSKLIFLNSSHAADAGHFYAQAAAYIADARKKGAKLVVMDPRLSNSAGMADLWIATWPGTEIALYLHLSNRLLQENKFNKKFVKRWFNWKVLMKDRAHLEYMYDQKMITRIPDGESFEEFIDLLKDMYSPYTLEFAAKETHVPAHKINELYDMILWAGDQITTYIWRASSIANRGGWMGGKAAYFLIGLCGAYGNKGGVGNYYWHDIAVGGKGGSATVSQGKSGKDNPKIKAWNELCWPPEWPLGTNEPSFLLPHLLADKEWQEKWRSKGLDVPTKLAIYMPRMYNPVWINPDGFRWIEVLKDESKIELSINPTPVWSETNWYVDYILPMGLAGERHDQHSEATIPAKWANLRQPVLRVALEKSGWKPKNPARGTLEAHIKAGLGEVWEENEFWFELAHSYVDPDGSLGIRDRWASKADPSRPVSVHEWYNAAFGDNLPKLRATVDADPKYKNEEYPYYAYMRDHGTWTEETDIFDVHEREIKYSDDELTKDEHDVLYVQNPDGSKKAVGVEVDGKKLHGLDTLDRKFDIYAQWLAKDWKWSEYAMPFYPRNDEEKEKYVHILSHVNHKYMKEENSFALNTVFRLPYNIHTRSANSKHLMEISQNHDPIWINTVDAKRMGIKRGDPIRVRIVDTVSELESGYFVAMAVPTEGVLPGVLACSHHAGRWKLTNSVNIPNAVTDGKVDPFPMKRDLNDPKFIAHSFDKVGDAGGEIKIEDFNGTTNQNSFGIPVAEISHDGKIGKMRYTEGIKPFKAQRFAHYNRDSGNVWWDGLSGSWQNAVAPAHPDPISAAHCWHQKVLVEKAQSGDKIGDIYVNYDNNFKTYQAWRDKLARPLDSNSKLRRPRHIKRPWVALDPDSYLVEIKD